MARVGRDARSRSPVLVAAGEAALVVRLGTAVSPAANRRVVRLLRTLDANPPLGLRDLVPAYASLLILWDPLLASVEAVSAAVRAALGARSHQRDPRGRLVRVPVVYGGEDGPDLDDVARLAGLSPDEVVRRHCAATYRVYFLGFLAGFPYLGGLPPELAVPRLPTPRPRVPAGSVGIAGQQTGIYPLASPGGWRLIGRTAVRLFDPLADPPALLRPGDRVQFEPVVAGSLTPRQTDTSPDRGALALPGGEQATTAATHCVPWVRVERPGWLTTVQDLGRPGYARYGVSASGAADADALRVGNALLGNPAEAAALEVTLGDLRLRALRPCAIALTGADCAARVGMRPLRPWMAASLEAGDVLELGMARGGARAYVCVAGGVAVPPALGSRATDTRAGLGGLEGRPLRAGDVLVRGSGGVPPQSLVGRGAPLDAGRRPAADGMCRLRVLPGPHADLAPDALERLVDASYVVDPNSDRVGVRLRWVDAEGGSRPPGGETITEGVPRGAVQVPPGGDPIILLADHQTTGGYRIPAVVIGADLWRVAQLRPGDPVRLALVTREEALAALREREAWLAALRERLMRQSREPGADTRGLEAQTLMRGFAEWSEGASDDE
jgi:KipI family sensor histidine kinase inhibitor